jgi:hypothetical protein
MWDVGGAPLRRALPRFATSVRESTPSLRKIDRTWLLTVLKETSCSPQDVELALGQRPELAVRLIAAE